ncbi:uncharacterized protein LOC116413230 [Galleria mellonella]|uniref:Uncharacterized protein LOC116413230 n=1 Tax=Galleria mellonella TaxID=7137 RepID=A0A6J3C7K6_GALME|nr:uncharacterized protein LOC116413230 [Galleria mellonella]
MSRYFYIYYCLLIYMKECFCSGHFSYYYINHKLKNYSAKSQRINKQIPVVNNNGRQYKRMSDSNNQMTQIDVANFIQKPDYYEIDEKIEYNLENTDSLTTKLYNDYDLLITYTNNEKNFQIDNNDQNYLDVDESKKLKYRSVDLSNPNINNANYFDKPLVNNKEHANIPEASQFEKNHRNKIPMDRDNLHKSTKR